MTGSALDGLHVLDLTTVVVGPACTLRLAQYGADVIKIEGPDGDLMRRLGGESPTGQHSGTYLHLNRGKRNLGLDLKAPASQPVVERLLEWADVVVANMRPRALERLGLDPAAVLDRFPRAIYCLITGFGTDGPYAGQPAYDSVVQGSSGIAGLMLERDGVPRYVPLVLCDHIVGEIAAGSILAALHQRERTARGCLIEVPMFETMAAFVLQEHLAQHSFDPPVGPPGDRRLLTPYNRPVQTLDGWIAFTVNTDAQVRAFLEVTGRRELVGDPRFSSVAARATNVVDWFEVRGAPLTERSTADWLELLRSVDIPAQPVHTLETLPSDPHLTAVGLLGDEEHPTEGRVVRIRPTIAFDGKYPDGGAPARPRGCDTHDVLGEVGFGADQVREFLGSGAAFESGHRRHG